MRGGGAGGRGEGRGRVIEIDLAPDLDCDTPLSDSREDREGNTRLLHVCACAWHTALCPWKARDSHTPEDC